MSANPERRGNDAPCEDAESKDTGRSCTHSSRSDEARRQQRAFSYRLRFAHTSETEDRRQPTRAHRWSLSGWDSATKRRPAFPERLAWPFWVRDKRLGRAADRLSAEP